MAKAGRARKGTGPPASGARKGTGPPANRARKGTGPPANSVRWPLVVIMAGVGVVWLGQGIGLIGGSFMTGESLWGIIGAGLLVGAAGLAMKRRG